MKKKILIVDDSQGWVKHHLALLSVVLGDKYEFETAYSAKEGYEKVYNNISAPYELIITDLQMEYDFEPKLAGEWFVEQVKNLKEYNNSRIIIISATFNIRMIAENLEVAYLPKSIAAKDLEAYKLKVQKVLGEN